MARKKKTTALGTLITVVVIAALLWMKYSEIRDGKKRAGETRDEKIEMTQPVEVQGDSEVSSYLTSVSLSSSRFEVLKNCTLIDHRGNDGDSFHVKTPKGNEELRLYYVDAPESSARTYGPGENNYKRIAQQGASMGGLNQHETTQVGVEAKRFVKKLLKGQKFTVATTREKVYHSHRLYAFIIVKWEGQKRYLHELLVARGLGRIHTKPMVLPDNTSASRHKQKLRKLEKYAKKKHYGAWGL